MFKVNIDHTILLTVNWFFSYWVYPLREVSKYGVISGPYFPVFGLTAEIYSVNLRIQSE